MQRLVPHAQTMWTKMEQIFTLYWNSVSSFEEEDRHFEQICYGHKLMKKSILIVTYQIRD